MDNPEYTQLIAIDRAMLTMHWSDDLLQVAARAAGAWIDWDLMEAEPDRFGFRSPESICIPKDTFEKWLVAGQHRTIVHATPGHTLGKLQEKCLQSDLYPGADYFRVDNHDGRMCAIGFAPLPYDQAHRLWRGMPYLNADARDRKEAP